MKVLVVLSAVLACGLAQPGLGYGYSAISPLTGYSSEFAPFSYAYSAPILSHITPYTAGLALPVKSQYHSQNELGMASYGHDEPGQSHHAIQDAEGNKYGSFSYVDHFGGVHQTRYSADALGYRVESNDAPIGPATAPLLHRRKRQAPQQWNAQPSWQNQAAAPQQSWQQTQPQTWQSNAVPQAREQTWMPGNTQQAALAPYNPAAAQPAIQFQPQSAQASRAYFQPQPQPSQSWQGAQAPAQIANIQVNPDGTLQDTPEVAQAKQLHFKEYQTQARAANAAPEAQMTSPAQFPQQQEDDGSYKPELYQGGDGRSWNSQPSQSQQTWNSGQEWNQQPAATSWNQQPAASWNQASERTYQQPQYQSSSQWNAPAPAPAVPSQATPYSASWQQQQPAQSWNQPQQQSWNQQPQSWESATSAPWQSQARSWEQPAAQPVVRDTPEVEAARQAHFQALADANRGSGNSA